MEKHKSNVQGIMQWVVIIVLVGNFVFFGFYVSEMRENYNLLTEEVSSLKLEIADRQNEIRNLMRDLDVLSRQLSLINEENDKKIGELDRQIVRIDRDFEMQFSKLDQRLGDLSVESEGFSDVISRVIGATVSVNTNVGQGSGAIISSDGLVVTNYHVIQAARRASVTTYSGESYRVSLVGYDAEQDIAVLEIISNESFDYFKFGNSDLLRAGQKVVALGNPAGLSFTATEGIVSSPLRRASDGFDYIQTDVTLNPGNSGGPLINSAGELVGIANFKVAGYQGLGFAIPSNRVKKVVDGILRES